jgi:hypothetical protein
LEKAKAIFLVQTSKKYSPKVSVQEFGERKIFIKEKPEWEVPIIRYAKTGQFPGWIKLLGRWDMGFRKGVFKLPMSH